MSSLSKHGSGGGIRLLVHDIDGCLNPPDGEDFGPGDSGGLSENQSKQLGRLKACLEAMNVQLVLNTGRNLEDSMAMAEGLVGNCCRYGLFEHGAYGWDFKKDQEIDLHQLSLEQGDSDRARKYEEMAVIPRLIEWYREKGRHRLSERLGVEPPPLRKRSNLSLECVQGLKAPHLMKNLMEVVEEGFKEKGDEPLVYCHSDHFVDVLGTVHKSDGAQLLCRQLGFSGEEVLVVGDGMNDMDMFSQWPNLLCPSNAFGDLKELCRRRGGVVSDQPYVEATLAFLRSGQFS